MGWSVERSSARVWVTPTVSPMPPRGGIVVRLHHTALGGQPPIRPKPWPHAFAVPLGRVEPWSQRGQPPLTWPLRRRFPWPRGTGSNAVCSGFNARGWRLGRNSTESLRCKKDPMPLRLTGIHLILSYRILSQGLLFVKFWKALRAYSASPCGIGSALGVQDWGRTFGRLARPQNLQITSWRRVRGGHFWLILLWWGRDV